MKLLVICFCFSIALSYPFNKKRNFQFKFTGGEKKSHAKLVGTIDHELTEFTVCHWSKTNRPVSGPAWEIIFNYYLPEKVSYILTAFQHNRLLHVYGDNKSKEVKLSLPSTQWIHLCFTWFLTDSIYDVYINGQHTSHQTHSTPSLPIKPNGVVQLGFHGNAVNRLSGQISDLNMWDYALTPDDVKQIYNCEYQGGGNVISWYDSAWELFDGTSISNTLLPCGGSH